MNESYQIYCWFFISVGIPEAAVCGNAAILIQGPMQLNYKCLELAD